MHSGLSEVTFFNSPGAVNLHTISQSAAYYESMYAAGYMYELTPEKKKRIYDIIRELRLPLTGDALDFGCGNGDLTEIIREALPLWRVYGTDISATAVSKAAYRYPRCSFFEPAHKIFMNKQFDFIFTHHVFEHVFNLEEVFAQVAGYLKDKSSMLHILPCGNTGSYEYNICQMRKDGINTRLENKFFFEEEGHLRRLTTEHFHALWQPKGFKLEKQFYSNQYYGSIEWITKKNPDFMIKLADPSLAVNKETRKKLRLERIRLLLINAFRLPVIFLKTTLNQSVGKPKDYVKLITGLVFYIFAAPVDYYWRKKARQEWDRNKLNPAASEMYLYFTKK